jgi:photosystem II stability/assembly factor-like uncharacterized protein
MNLNRLAVTFLTIGLALPSQAALQFVVATNGPSSLNGIAYDNTNTFVAAGLNSTIERATFAGAGLPWVSNSVPSPGLILEAATYGSGIFVVGGETANNFSSTNGGTTWSTNSGAFSIPATVQGLGFNGGRFAAVSALSKIGYAPNASLTWADATIDNPISLESYRAVTPLGTNGFAACGIRGDIRTSPDGGTNWYVARAFTLTDPDLYGIASDGSTNLVCVGQGGTILRSTNSGTNWTAVSSGATTNLNAAAYTGSGFIVAGDGGLILTSPDGVTWTNASSPTVTNLNAVLFGTSGQLQGVAVLVGAGGTVVIGGTVPAAPVTNAVGSSSQTNCSFNLPNPPLTVVVLPDGAHPAGTVGVDWYDAAAAGNRVWTNSTSLSPANTIAPTNAPTNYIYYAEARDLRTGFTSTNRTPVTLTLYPRPTAVVSGTTTICNGESTTIQVVLTGVAPWTVTWLSNGIPIVTNAGVMIPTNTLTNSPVNPGPNLATNAYTVTNLSDFYNCDAFGSNLTGEAVITINPTPTVTQPTNQTVCSGGETAQVNFTGNATSFAWTNDTTSIGLAASGNGNIDPFTASNGETTSVVATITVTPHYLNNNVDCTGLPQSFTITVNPIPAQTITPVASAVCAGSTGNTASVSVTSGATYSWSISGGTITAGQASSNVTYTAGTGSAVTLSCVVTSSAGCVSAGGQNVSVTVVPQPEISSVTMSANNVVLVWTSLVGVGYQVQYTTDLTTPVTWTDLGSPVNATGATATYTDSLPTDVQRFYQISVVCP